MDDNMKHLLPQNSVELMLVLDALHEGLLIVDASGTVLAINKAARRFYKGGEIPFPGYPLSDFDAADWVEVKRVLASGQAQLGRPLTLPCFSVVVNRMPILRDGVVLGVVNSMQDTTAFENIIAQLGAYQELEGELVQILEQCNQGLLVVDSAGKVIRVNTTFETLVGTGRDSLLGHHLGDMAKDATGVRRALLETLRTRQQHILRHVRDDGFPFLVISSPSFDERGAVKLAVACVLDLRKIDAIRLDLEVQPDTFTACAGSLREENVVEQIAVEAGIIAKSRAMSHVVHRATKVSQTESSVLLEGESGVGKSMLAALIHRLSPRRDRRLVAINCGAIPESLVESELFGYERGAFTGANPKGKVGLIEAGNLGTVFFDEIGELTLPMQVKLLEAIDKKAFVRVGGTRSVAVDFRVIAATNRNLEDEVAKGNFRKDLYYRLNVIPIHIPPLRERKEDIPALALDILARHNARHATKKRFSPEVMEILMQHSFPGNARELVNVIEWMVVMGEGQTLTPNDLPVAFKRGRADTAVVAGAGGTRHAPPCAGVPHSLKEALNEAELRCILQALSYHATLHEAAQALGIHPTTLWRKMVQHNIREKACGAGGSGNDTVSD